MTGVGAWRGQAVRPDGNELVTRHRLDDPAKERLSRYAEAGQRQARLEDRRYRRLADSRVGGGTTM